MGEKKIIFKTRDNSTLVGKIYFPFNSNKTIVFSHGWASKVQNYESFLRKLSDKYTVIAFDQRSHGQSRGKFTRKNCLTDLLDIKKSFNIENLTLMGHSMGGYCTLLSAKTTKPDSIVVFNPYFSSECLHEGLSLMLQILKKYRSTFVELDEYIPEQMIKKMGISMTRPFETTSELADMNILEHTPKAPLESRLLYFFSSNDTVIKNRKYYPVLYKKILNKMFKSPQDASHLIDGLNHNLNKMYSSTPFFANQRDEVFDKIASFIDQDK